MVDDSFLEAKKRLVESLTRQFEKILGIGENSVTINFCDRYTPSGRKALACIQPETRNLYISLIHLNNMSKEEIKKTVAHELAHIFVRDHTPEFYGLLNELLMGTWTPEGATGIISINGGKHVDKMPKKPEKKKVDKTVCNKNACDSKDKLKRCVHCRGYYCEEHIKPFAPRLPNFDVPNRFYDWKENKNGHACPAYVDYLTRKEKERIKKYEKSINSMSYYGSKYGHYDTDYSEESTINEEEIDEYPKIVFNESGNAKGACSYCYPRGDKEIKKLVQCKHCKEWFCEKHIKPKEPMSAPFKSNDREKQDKWKDKNGHPCAPYVTNPTEDLDSEEVEVNIEKKDEGGIVEKESEEKQTEDEEISDITCSFCSSEGNKDSKELTKCVYCNKWFCKEHIDALTNHESLGGKKGHPCTPYEKYQSITKKYICSECGKKISSKEKHEINTVFGEDLVLCTDCYNKEKSVNNPVKAKKEYGSKIKSKLKNLKYRFGRKTYRKSGFSSSLLLGLFVPLFVGLLVLYLLEPGLSLMFEYSNFEYGIQWLLVFLLLPAEVNSYVPWIAWIASGFAGGIISRRVLIPFVSMYILIWVMLFVFAGDTITQSFGYLGGFGLEQILIQTLIINFIYAILAFGFGGWIGASIRGR